jgi:hypothetical protein
VTWLEQASSVAAQLRSPLLNYLASGNLGIARLFLGQFDGAQNALTEALAISQDLGASDLIDEPLLGVAIVAAKRGHAQTAARLLGTAESHQTGTRDMEEEIIWTRLHHMLESLVGHFDATEWRNAYRQGEQLAISEAIELARLDDASTPAR